jgi:hypothetical protein
LDRLVFTERFEAGLVGRCGWTTLALSRRRSRLTVRARPFILFLVVVHVVVFEMFVTVLDEQVVDCFFPCFPDRQCCIKRLTHSSVIKAATISSSGAPCQSVLRLPMISGSISSAELTGRSTSSRDGGETRPRPGIGLGARETKNGCSKISGICRQHSTASDLQ